MFGGFRPLLCRLLGGALLGDSLRLGRQSGALGLDLRGHVLGLLEPGLERLHACARRAGHLLPGCTLGAGLLDVDDLRRHAAQLGTISGQLTAVVVHLEPGDGGQRGALLALALPAYGRHPWAFVDGRQTVKLGGALLVARLQRGGALLDQ